MYREQLKKWYEQAKEILTEAEKKGLCKVKQCEDPTLFFTPNARDKDGCRIWSLSAFRVEWKVYTGEQFEAARGVMSKLLPFMPAQQWEKYGGSCFMSRIEQDASFDIFFAPFEIDPLEWSE